MAQTRKNTTASKASAPHEQQWEVVNRVVYPVRDADLTMPLYVIEWTRPHLTDAVMDPHVNRLGLDFSTMNKTDFQHLVNEGIDQHANTSSRDVFSVDDRVTLTVHPGRHVTLSTFFNAFPASYWRRWTAVSAVRFIAEVNGKGAITLFRSTGRGLFAPAATVDIDTTAAGKPQTIAVDLDMKGLVDGGYFWFDANADDDNGLTIANAAWSVPVSERIFHGTSGDDGQQTSLSIAITTFNRPSYAHNQIKAMAAEPELRKRLDTIYLTDQGTDLVRNQPGFDDTANELGPQLTYIRQANLGGSGGFSRGMYETVNAGKSAYTLLLDDDAISEPEAILRAVQFADYCRKPTIVGGGMLHLDNRTMLYSAGESFNFKTFVIDPAGGLPYNHDFATAPLRDSPELHRRIDVNFNAWWMCLVPTAVIKEIGLAMPVFIKYDDIEFGLRAGEHGFNTVCLPGVAVWHQAWHDKDPGRNWEEYFNQRNRWICALLHAPKPSWHVPYQQMYGDMAAGLRLVYSAVHLRHLALRDVMRGPENIVKTMPTQLAEVRRERSQFTDAQAKPRLDDFPAPQHEFVDVAKPRPAAQVAKEGVRSILKALASRADGTKDTQPEVAIPAKDAVWESFNGVNSALVTTPDGNGVAWFRRDSKLFREQTRRGLIQSKALMDRWDELSQQYKDYDLPSFDVWKRIFTSDVAKPQNEG